MYKRLIASFSTLVLLLCILTARLALLSTADTLSQAATQQSTFTLDISSTRGRIYDFALRPLTGRNGAWRAAVLPCAQSSAVLLRAMPPEERPALLRQIETLMPFVCTVPTDALYARGIDVFWIPQRCTDVQTALHLIGGLDAATGHGASGLEKAYDQLLTSAGGTLRMRYSTDALRRPIPGESPEVLNSGYHTGAGLVLTLDRDIQELAERAAASIQKGAVVVMDPYTGNIKASVSRPTYNPNDMSTALNSSDSPFINRAFYAYPVGSTMKVLTACSALEQGVPPSRTFCCEGSVEVGNVIFRCHNLSGHNLLDMTGALAHSCNPYFITLALQIGGPTLLFKASQLGFGCAAELAPGMRTQPGTLPTPKELIAPAATANFGFGQGILTATPLQIASLVSAMANGGGAITPRLVEGTTTDGKTFASHTATYAAVPVFAPAAARMVRDMMISVVEQGSGTTATPRHGGAGGKTASAQTGRFVDGVEEVHAWFSGFYPAKNPQYTIVVLVEGGDSGSEAACPVFKAIADGLDALHLN
ncbi:MAG: penicillin-binding protein 2 [Oscillospiraceae bacterium]